MDDDDENIELDNYSLRDLEAYIRERKAEEKRKATIERRRAKHKEQLAIRLAREEEKELARKKLLDEYPLRKEQRKLRYIQEQKESTEKRLAEAEAVIDANEKKIEEGLTPIKIGEELVLKDVVDDILTSYTPAVKKAIYKYRGKNIQKYNDYSREYNKKRMEDPAYAKHKKMMNARSNEKARLKRLREREALQKKVVLVKCDSIPVTNENVIIETNNGN